MGSKSSNLRKEKLDLAFTDVAEVSSRYTLTGRRYHGIFNGRRFDAYITKVKDNHSVVSGGVYAGEHLEIILDSNMKVRFKAGSYDQLLSKTGVHFKSNMSVLKEAPEGLIAYSLDVEWGIRIMKNEKAADLLAGLLTPLDQAEIRNLSLWPGAAMLSLHRLNPANITAVNIKHWITCLMEWVEALEDLPPAKRKAEESKWDNTLRGDRKLIFKLALTSLVSFLLFIAALILVPLWLTVRNGP